MPVVSVFVSLNFNPIVNCRSIIDVDQITINFIKEILHPRTNGPTDRWAYALDKMSVRNSNRGNTAQDVSENLDEKRKLKKKRKKKKKKK